MARERARRVHRVAQMTGIAVAVLGIVLSTGGPGMLGADARPLAASGEQQHNSNIGIETDGHAHTGIVAASVVASVACLCGLVLALFFCTDGEKDAQDPNLNAFERRESVVNMESNPYYAGKQDKPMMPGDLAPPKEIDEDELADARMDAEKIRPRTTSVLLKQISLKRDRTFIHHSTRRPDAEQQLLQHVTDTGESGVFLLRAKREDEGMYALDVGWKDTASNSVYVTHHLLSRSQTGVYMVDEQMYDRLMSLEDVISYLSKPRNRALPGALTTFIPTTDAAEDLPPQQIQSAA